MFLRRDEKCFRAAHARGAYWWIFGGKKKKEKMGTDSRNTFQTEGSP